jgi:hypothetical protein
MSGLHPIFAQIIDSHFGATKAVTLADTHRGWLIEQNWLGEWEATHPDFDPTPVYLDDGPSDNRYVTAKTRADVIEAIDDWYAEEVDL